MGIPSYFSFVVKNYPNILKNIEYFKDKNIEVLGLDSNSIIYDSVSRIINEYQGDDDQSFENKIIDSVILKIEEYIRFIMPKDSVYIAFDGVPPLAKMKQQRIRRNKSNYLDYEKPKWNRNKITPGTQFMSLLSARINMHFKGKEKQFNVKNIEVSCSDEVGEGEHKLMEYIRNNDLADSNIAIYGLDSDLIMLSIFHSVHCKNIYVFREAPVFLSSSIPKSIINEDKIYFLDVSIMMSCILRELEVTDKHRVFDYVFFCFFLGNDFLPHFPALNIRTSGFDVLYNAYTKLFKYSNNYLLKKDFTVDWIQLNKFIKYISNIEEKIFQNEFTAREKMENRPLNTDKFNKDMSEKDIFIDNIPIKYRMVEKTINPYNDYWQRRYYKYLFGKDVQIKDICLNYIDGLVWVLNYYLGRTKNFTYIYNYDYGPLLFDLKKYFPHFNMENKMEEEENCMPFKDTTLLAYVLPISDYGLIPSKKKDTIKNNYFKYLKQDYKINWAYVKYMWEAHPSLPKIPLNILREWDKL